MNTHLTSQERPLHDAILPAFGLSSWILGAALLLVVNTSLLAATPSNDAPCTAHMVCLPPGQEQVVSASARVRWNHTRIAVNADEAYEITARGSWSDASHTVTAKGYELRRLAPFRPFRRQRDASWFELIGALGESERTAFRIGEQAPVTFHASGELVLYANEACFMYWNNSGSIDVVVRRVR